MLTDKADGRQPPQSPPFFLTERFIYEPRGRHRRFVHFQAVPFPKAPHCCLGSMTSTPFTTTAEMLSGEPEPRFGFCQKHLRTRLFHFSYFQYR